MAQRGDARRHAAADRIGQAQQIDRQHRLLLEHFFDLADVGVVAQQAEESDQRKFRSLQMLAADHCRAGEVVALEQVEAQVVAEFHLLDAFHFLSEQRLAQRLEIGNELLQSRRFDAADVDLDDLRKFQELAILVQ